MAGKYRKSGKKRRLEKRKKKVETAAVAAVCWIQVKIRLKLEK